MREGYRTILESEDPKGFTCRICGGSYKEEEQAQDCCEHVEIRVSNSTKIYQCNWCYRKHVTQITAKKCCPARNYKCSNCGELFTIQQFMNNEICPCERRIHQVILF